VTRPLKTFMNIWKLLRRKKLKGERRVKANGSIPGEIISQRRGERAFSGSTWLERMIKERERAKSDERRDDAGN